MRTYKTEGIVIGRINFGEADRILTIYTRGFGKLRVLAKSARKLTSRKSGALELFNQVKLCLAKGKNLDIITEAEVVRSFRPWRRNLKKVALAYHFSELVERLTPENQKSEEIFSLLAGSLFGLGQATESQLKDASENFARKLLESTGFWPRGSKKTINFQVFIENLVEKKLNAKEFFRFS